MAVTISVGNTKSKAELNVILINAQSEKKFSAFEKGDQNKLLSWLSDRPGDIYPLTNRENQRWIIFAGQQHPEAQVWEYLRKKGHELLSWCNQFGMTDISIDGKIPDSWKLALAEGLLLSSYAFDKYKNKKLQTRNTLKTVELLDFKDKEGLRRIKILSEAVSWARDLVNEPPSKLSPQKLSKAFMEMGRKGGFSTEVLQKKQIESLKMGGIMAVNRGSIDPPTFTIMEFKPDNAINKKPFILVGKGVTFDSGGLNIKTLSMELMKCDMAGAAAVAATIYAVAKSGLPIHVIALVPSTDNKTGPDALAPGDVIEMSDGTTVEVANTDAEGRLILADAIAYAQKYKPHFIVDAATLTGAAMRAIGYPGMVVMGTLGASEKSLLFKAGDSVHERVVEFPLWDEYAEEIKSPVADIKNLGSPLGGAITAGKFLQHFTKGIPWMHLDIAGPAFLEKKDSYRGQGGTGTGVRLLFTFLESLSRKDNGS